MHILVVLNVNLNFAYYLTKMLVIITLRTTKLYVIFHQIFFLTSFYGQIKKKQYWTDVAGSRQVVFMIIIIRIYKPLRQACDLFV